MLILVYTLCRAIFLWYNQNLLGTTFPADSILFLHGLRFDVAAISAINLPVTIACLMNPSRLTRRAMKFAKIYFTAINSFVLLCFWVDVVYFPFIQKRLQFDAFLFVTGGKGTEFWNLLPVFLLEYWWAWIGAAISLWAMFVLGKTLGDQLSVEQPKRQSRYFRLLLIPAILMHLFIMRGGWQLRPLSILHATESVGPEKAPAVLNTAFSLWRTMQKQVLQPVQFPESAQMSPLESGIHMAPLCQNALDTQTNVVVIMVESLSSNLLGREGMMTSTPFLDSLVSEGWYFPNTIANAKESVQGVPAVLASIPAWMDDPYIFSRYSTNHITSLATVLRPLGYRTMFFHGAMKGTMGFDLFCRSAGFDRYLAKEDYPFADRDFDGGWGIWDHCYLPYMARECSNVKGPFLAAVLTLNTHHPFRIPKSMEHQFSSPGHPILKSVAYADESLRQFFVEARKQPWYQNTLFVLTADHPGPDAVPFRPKIEKVRIPLLFFHPSGKYRDLKGQFASQIDVLPTVAAMLQIKSPFFSLGQNLCDTTASQLAMTYQSGMFQAFTPQWRILTDGAVFYSGHQWQSDPLYTRSRMSGLQQEPQWPTIKRRIQTKIQAFHYAVLYDKMTAEAYEK